MKRAIGSSAVARDERAEQRRERDPADPDEDQRHEHLVEHVVHLGERPGDLDRAVVADALRQHHQVDAVDRHVADVAPAAGLGDLARERLDRQLAFGAGRAVDVAVRRDPLDESARAAERLLPRWRRESAPRAEGGRTRSGIRGSRAAGSGGRGTSARAISASSTSPRRLERTAK